MVQHEHPAIRTWKRLHHQLFGSQLRRNMISASALSGVSAIITGLSYTLYLNLLGYEQYGVWLVLSMVISFYQIGNLGVSQGVAKKIAEYRAQQDAKEVTSFVTTGTVMMGALGVVMVVVISLLRACVPVWLHVTGPNAKLITQLVPLTACYSAYLFVGDIANSALNGLGRLDLCYLCQTGLQMMTLVFSLAALKSNLGVPGMLMANTLAYLLFHLLSLILIARLIKRSPLSFGGMCFQKARALLGFGGWLFGSTILGMLMSPVNRAMLTRYSSLAAVPLYDIPFNSCLRLKSFIDGSQKALISEVSALSIAHRETDLPRVKRLVMKASRLLAASAVPFLLLGIVVTPLLKLWLQARYVPEMSLSFRIMLVSAFASLVGVPSYYALLGLGKGVHIFVANLLQTLVNLCVVLIIIQAGWSVTAPHLLWAVAAGYVSSSLWLGIACQNSLVKMQRSRRADVEATV